MDRALVAPYMQHLVSLVAVQSGVISARQNTQNTSLLCQLSGFCLSLQKIWARESTRTECMECMTTTPTKDSNLI